MEEKQVEEIKQTFDIDQYAAELTYAVCNGKQIEERDMIFSMWKGVIKSYMNEIAYKKGESRMKIVVNRFGASAMHGLDLDEDVATNDVSRGELFFKAMNAMLYGKRTSREGVKVVNTSKNGIYAYETLETGMSKGEPIKEKDLEILRENVSVANIVYLDDDDKGTGTTLKIDNGNIKVSQRLGDTMFDVLEINRTASGTAVKIVVDTVTASSKTFTIDSKKSYWDIKRGLLWNDVYPFPSSAREFMNVQNGTEEPVGDD